MNTFDYAIIGGGFCGLMSLYHAVQNMPEGVRIVIFEPRESLGLGLAYSTSCNAHVLNVHAGNMSALWDQPHHLVDWLKSPAGKAASLQIGVKQEWDEHDYIPRRLYGLYLMDFIPQIHSKASEKNIVIEFVRAVVRSIDKKGEDYVFMTDTDLSYFSDMVILALGNKTQSDKGSKKIIHDIWNFDYSVLHTMQEPVAIIGSGLSMIDILQSLRGAGYEGHVYVISRRGLLPKIHEDNIHAYESQVKKIAGQKNSLRQLIKLFRQDIDECAKQGYSWQSVFSVWRPYLVELWAGMSKRDKMCFFSSLFTIWGVHRHRICSQVGDFLALEIEKKRVEIVKGNPKFRENNDGVEILLEGSSLNAGYVFDCRGISYDISQSQDPLLQSLLKNSLIESHETGWGIKAGKNFKVINADKASKIFVIGSLLTGERLETIAVPELRKQAYDVVMNFVES